MNNDGYAQSSIDLSNNKLNLSNTRPVTASYFNNLDTGISVKPPFTRDQYEYFRPGDTIPVPRTQDEYRRVMKMTNAAYEQVGLIRSVVDLMVEFVIDGVEINSDVKKVNTFYKTWAKKVKLKSKAEQYATWLYANGNVVVRRMMGQVEGPRVQDLKGDISLSKIPPIKPGFIPLDYKFYNPVGVEILGDGFSGLSDVKSYGIRVPLQVFDNMKKSKKDYEKEVFNGLPLEVKKALEGKIEKRSSSILVPIPADRVFVGHYKKRDSEIWSKSFLYSVLSDVQYNNKVKLAKIAGLDGWCNSIRIWKLGDHKNNQYPAPALYTKLINILEQNAGGGAIDIVWRSDIECQEIYPPVEKLANLNENTENILFGLGVPKILVGGSMDSAGAESAFLGLKNFISKLEIVRRSLIEWMESEIAIVNLNMGFDDNTYIRFAYNNLHDDRVLYNLLIQLVDRNIISDATVLDRIKEIPEIEKNRLKVENEMREAGELPEKASPFHKPDMSAQHEHEINKIKVQTKENAKVGKSPVQSENEVNRKVGSNPNGRPPGRKDSLPRSKSKSKVMFEGAHIYDRLDEWVKSNCLKMWSLSSVRSMTSEQDLLMDQYRMAILPSIDPSKKITDEYLTELCQNPEDSSGFATIYNGLIKEVGAESMTFEDKRLLRIYAYAEYWGI